MLSTNTTFDTAHALAYKQPMYLIHFDGEAVDFVNYEPGSADNTCKKYLSSIGGLSQVITPEEGKSSIGGITINIQDYDNEITALLATDTYNFHRRKTTITAGYKGMTEANMVTVFTGWVTGLKLSGDGLNYIFSLTDPQKWMQRKVFRGAESSTVTIQGNPINILLAVLMSSGTPGTNGTHDYLAETNGLNLTSDYINVTNIESMRDTWFPGDSHYMKFSITERITAKDFIEKEILKVLNIYPVIDGDGKYNLKPYKPPIAGYTEVQTFTEDTITGLPTWDANLAALVNEVEVFYDHDGDDFQSQLFYIDSTSLNNRGPGKKPITIKSKGLHSSLSPSSLVSRAGSIILRRKNRIFGRFANPPLKMGLSTFFSRWLSEAGDIVPVTVSQLPDIEAGTRGLSLERMEIDSRQIDWGKGAVKVGLLNTGYAKGNYAAVSPTMTVLSAEPSVPAGSDTFYPVVSGDDGSWIPDGQFWGDAEGEARLPSMLQLGTYDGTDRNSFIRVPSMTPGKGCEIVSAYFINYAFFDYDTGTCKVNCYFNNIGDAIAPTDATEAEALELTSAVAWTVPRVSTPNSYNTPELMASLQEVVNHDDWSTGNAVMALFKNNGSTYNAYRAMCSIDYDSGSKKPALYVEWTAGDTRIVVSAADAAKFANFTDPEVQFYDAGMRAQGSHVTIKTINTTTGVITCDNIELTPVAGWIVTFANYDDCTAEQQRYGFAADTNDYLGADDDAAHLVVP